MRKINIGNWITIKEDFKDKAWFTRKPLRVIDKEKTNPLNKGVCLLSLDHNFSMMPSYYSNTIAEEFVEYYPMRELKLKRILEDD